MRLHDEGIPMPYADVRGGGGEAGEEARPHGARVGRAGC